jgi:hypothetical protein
VNTPPFPITLFGEDNAARAIVQATTDYNGPDPINIGTNREISIRDLITLICQLMDYPGEILWQTDKPNGQPRRCLDISRASQAFGFKAEGEFEQGLRNTIHWYRQNSPLRKRQPNKIPTTLYIPPPTLHPRQNSPTAPKNRPTAIGKFTKPHPRTLKHFKKHGFV